MSERCVLPDFVAVGLREALEGSAELGELDVEVLDLLLGYFIRQSIVRLRRVLQTRQARDAGAPKSIHYHEHEEEGRTSW